MKRSITGALCAFALALSSIAVAAVPGKVPNCGIDTDGDGYCTSDVNTLMAQPGSNPPAPRLLGAEDCNDADPSVNPAAREIAGDGINNDCDGSTKDSYNVDTMTFARNGGRCNLRDAKCLAIIEEEIDVCNSAGVDACEVVYQTGEFGLKPDTAGGKYHLQDKNCDGKREVVLSQADYDSYVTTTQVAMNVGPGGWIPTPAGYCPGTRSSCGSAPTCGRSGSGTAKKPAVAGIAPAEQKKLDAGQDDLLKGLRTDVDRIDGKVTKQGKKIKALRTDVDALRGSLSATNQAVSSLNVTVNGDENNSGLVQTVGRLRADHDALKGQVDGVQDTANRAKASADFNARNGLLLELAVGGGLIYQGALNLESNTGADLGQARSNWAQTLRLGANIGADLEGGRYYLTGRFNPTLDDGDGGMSYEGGAVTEWKVDDAGVNYLGLHAEYVSHKAGGNVVNAAALSDGVVGGLTYARKISDPDGLVKHMFSARIGLGYERYGSEGRARNTEVEGGTVWMASLEYAPGIGARN